ncbi:deoxyhypusine synthase [Candidatus Peregrinibacteria bacterium CG10_big_fil_rev_8_21_14_0_10_49_24]|nr:MAG: deoxyhypusine synthase [Candidatus Peregrinibacteria bacterium CG11_big_fil_rev_8_21_14_0_20_49_14]PIR51259.1 MAG: deoxyhypusine synthase [Candidatus Peregrinibacteria bacterium CG10_big_fil_rev_8_21_14_0_10_49_24]PJA68067.1 MAG: deoxyhypusine synthase [Candidatus Peregrinibacteria bacterium CG_4_9_14_3_um_filter_49_12]
MSVVSFMDKHYKHFNAREMRAAAQGWHEFCRNNGKMFVSLAGAMSTAEIGISLAPVIRAGKVHAITCTGANIEEDLFNLVGNSRYKLQPKWRYLTMEDDLRTREEGYNRVTDTCIPEDVMIQIHEAMRALWAEAAIKEERYFHWEYFYALIRSGFFEEKNDVPMEHSWVTAACEMNIPIFTPGMEDSTLGNMFCADVMQGLVGSHNVIKSGTEQFEHLTNWYYDNQKEADIGFFQIGGGIAGDFAMCVIPGLVFDHERVCKCWKYFCHIGDSTTSYGSYSGCPANEKVTWYKLEPDTPNFTINSDASIVAPLIFSYVLEKHSKEEVANATVRDVAGTLKKSQKKSVNA